jgi:hypothetical protein
MPFGAQMYQDLMAEQEAQKPSFGERLATDPFFQMGAAILGAPGHGGNFMTAVGQGMSQGLQNAQAAEAARRETMQNQVRNRLWMEQLNNERFRLLGGEQPTAFEQGQMRYWEGQTANKAKENWLREQGLYDGGGGSPGMEPWGIVGPDGSVRYESVPKGQVPKTAPDERLFNPRVGKKEGAGADRGAKSDGLMEMYDELLRTTEQGIEQALQTPEGRRSFGSMGKPGRALSAAADILDNVTGLQSKEAIKRFFGGQDPVVVNNYLKYSVLPVARLMVDKGVLAGAEQARAKALVTIAQGKDASGEAELLGPEQAAELVTLTLSTARRAVNKGKGLPPQWGDAGGTRAMPPETATEVPPPSGSAGLSPEDQAELERLRQQQGGL